MFLENMGILKYVVMGMNIRNNYDILLLKILHKRKKQIRKKENGTIANK